MSKKQKKPAEPQYYVSKINTPVLNYGVYVMNASEKLLYSLVLFVIGGAVGLIFYGGLFKENGVATFMTFVSNIVVFAVVGMLAVKYFLPSVADRLRKKRAEKLKTQFCDFASSLTNSLASGMNITDSLNATYIDLQSQYAPDAFIVNEVLELISGVSNNIPIEVMLEDFGIRSGIPDILNFSTVFATCYRTGGNIKNVVRRTTDIISEKLMIASEIDTAMTSNKMQMNIMNVLPIVIVFMMRMMSSAFSESFSSLIGVIGLTVSAGLTVVAYKLGKKITDIKG